MSSWHKLTAALALVALLVANSTLAAANPSISKQDLAIWQAEGTGGGKLEHYKPARPPGYYHLGVKATAAEIAGWTIVISPDGANLPPGRGTVDQGSDIFSSRCAMCHGTFGEGAAAYPKLAGGAGSLGTAPVKTVGSYWPYATTLYDYINRAMPFFAPHSLKPDQVYALTAFILNLNGIVPDDFVANAATVPMVKMPNRNGFDWKDPRPFQHDPECMKNCADPASLKITSNAADAHLTPRITGPVDTMSETTRQGHQK